MKKEIFTKGLICSIAGAVFAIIGFIGLGLNWLTGNGKANSLLGQATGSKEFKLGDYYNIVADLNEAEAKTVTNFNIANVLLWFLIIFAICALALAVVKEFIKKPKVKANLRLSGLICGCLGAVLAVVWLILMVTGAQNISKNLGASSLNFSMTYSVSAGVITLFIGFLLASASSVVSCLFKK